MKKIRVRTKIGEDKFIPIDLNQKFDELNILSLTLTQEDAYQRFCSDYGVVMGRISTNDGVGIPNAKVSIFIPISPEDKEDSIKSVIYPYRTPYDLDSNGYRYNLLPESCDVISRVNEAENCTDIERQLVSNGTFPSIKRLLNDDIILEIFRDYYSFTTTTNSAGDYMIFGAPVGDQVLHVDIDVSDIGDLSMTPYDFIELGYSENQFAVDENGVISFNRSTNLDELPQIITLNNPVNIQPFWGDLDTCQAGITRHDIDLTNSLILQRTITFFGSAFTSQVNSYWSDHLGQQNDAPDAAGNFRAEDYQITAYKKDEFDIERVHKIFNITDSDGVFCINLPMYQDFFITDEFGNEVPSENGVGVAKRGEYRFKFNILNHINSIGNSNYSIRGTHYVPQPRPAPCTFVYTENGVEEDYRIHLGGGGKSADVTYDSLLYPYGVSEVYESTTSGFDTENYVVAFDCEPSWLWFNFKIGDGRYYSIAQYYGGNCFGNRDTYAMRVDAEGDNLELPNTYKTKECVENNTGDSRLGGGTWVIGSLFFPNGEVVRRNIYSWAPGSPGGAITDFNSGYSNFFSLIGHPLTINPSPLAQYDDARVPVAGFSDILNGVLYYGLYTRGFGGTAIVALDNYYEIDPNDRPSFGGVKRHHNLCKIIEEQLHTSRDYYKKGETCLSEDGCGGSDAETNWSGTPQWSRGEVGGKSDCWVPLCGADGGRPTNVLFLNNLEQHPRTRGEDGSEEFDTQQPRFTNYKWADHFYFGINPNRTSLHVIQQKLNII